MRANADAAVAGEGKPPPAMASVATQTDAPPAAANPDAAQADIVESAEAAGGAVGEPAAAPAKQTLLPPQPDADGALPISGARSSGSIRSSSVRLLAADLAAYEALGLGLGLSGDEAREGLPPPELGTISSTGTLAPPPAAGAERAQGGSGSASAAERAQGGSGSASAAERAQGETATAAEAAPQAPPAEAPAASGTDSALASVASASPPPSSGPGGLLAGWLPW